MNTGIFSPAILALTLAFTACQKREPAPSNEAQQAAILNTLNDYFAAVNARDPAKFLGFFVETEDLTVIEDKDMRLSRKAFVAFVEDFFKGVSEIKATWEKRSVYPLSPTSAVVTGAFQVVAKDDQGKPMAFRSAFTFVLVRQGGRWLVKHVHESSLEPQPVKAETGAQKK